MALTTTTGDCGRRSLTMVAARTMASASSTEVPPNFITIMPALQSGSFRQIPLRVKQLGIQQRRAGRATDHIVRKHGEFPIKKSAGAKPPDGDAHARAGINVETGLRPIGGIHIYDRLLGRVRE